MVRAAWVAGLAVLTLAIGACGSPGHAHPADSVLTHTRGIPPGVMPPAADAAAPEPIVAWAAADEIYLTTWGSSSCPRLPTEVAADGPHALRITTAEIMLHAGDTACTSDLAPTTSTVQLPSQIEGASGTLGVDVDGSHATLRGRSGR